MTQSHKLGELEQIVMLAVLRLEENAYGAAIQRELEERAGRAVTIATIYVTLTRLEAKGFVASAFAEGGGDRGGRSVRRKRFEPVRSFGGFSGLFQDLRFALRALRKQDALSLLAVVTLALGIGATTVVWGVVDGVLLRPLPYPESDRLVDVWGTYEPWRDAENRQSVHVSPLAHRAAGGRGWADTSAATAGTFLHPSQEYRMFRTAKTTGAAFVLALASALPVAAQHAQHAQHGASGADAEAIRAVVTSAYVEGIHRNGSRDAIRKGFHPGFVMKVLTNGQLSDVTIEQWISRLPAEGTPVTRRIEHRFPSVVVTGDAAVATVELDIDGRHTFTDYISLYRFPEGWRMVGKVFHRHAS